MSGPLITEFLSGKSKEIKELASNEAVLVGFLTLLKGVDDLPGLDHRFYETKRSLYQVTSSTISMDNLMEILFDFFGDPAKVPGKTLPVSYRFDPTVKSIGGVRKDQALYLKKLKTGTFFGALWPWQQEPQNIEILLGYHSTTMNASDYGRFEELVEKFLSKKKIESVAGVGGQIHGISLPSFLQMSEMEGATYTLNVTSGARVGFLHVADGNLIGAQYNGYTGNEAAYRIISWENTAIQIEPAEPGRAREINDSLMQVMMESLKIKDESEDETDHSDSDSGPVSSSPPLLSALPQVNEEKQLAPPEKEPASPPPPPPEVSEPVEKPEDHSIGKQNKMSRTQKLLVVLGVVILFAVSVTGGGVWMEKREASLRYKKLQSDLGTSDALDAKIVLLIKYLNAYPEDSHRPALENRLEALNKEIESSDYEKTIADVNSLPIDEQFEKKALSLYTAFLARYPESIYVESINDAIGGIDRLMGTAYYESLKKVSAKDFFARYKAYRTYLEQFPQSDERKAVEQMIVDLANETANGIEKQVSDCHKKQQWGPCIARCDEFITAFDAPVATVQKIKKLRFDLQDQKDLKDLTAKASLEVDDFEKARQIYRNYLNKRPETSKKKEILDRIERLTVELSKKEAWLSTKQYSANPANDIFRRIQRLNSYIEGQTPSPYETQAKELRTQLDPEFKRALSAKLADERRRMELARQKASNKNRDIELMRIQQIKNRVAGSLKPLESRYTTHRDGTVTDRITGLTWCLLDSYLALDKCISYESAKTYVQSLNTGGYSDWRLPTAGELATIYKNSPFFPKSGAPWYWSSESFARGFHRVVDVVTPDRESEFKRISKREDNLGAVRAVRR
jgi:hypothetical protein